MLFICEFKTNLAFLSGYKSPSVIKLYMVVMAIQHSISVGTEMYYSLSEKSEMTLFDMVSQVLGINSSPLPSNDLSKILV